VLTTDDFSEAISGGTYSYEATYTVGADGDYTATLEETADGSGNDGATDQAVTVSVTSGTTTGEWPTYHRNSRNRGYLPDTTGPTSSVESVWDVSFDGRIVHALSVADGRVYVGCRDYNAYAFDAESGDQLWQFETGDWVDGTPAVGSEYVYVGSNDGSLYALDKATGTEEWAFTGGGMRAPTLVDDSVYVPSDDGNIYAIDAATGTEIWTFETDGRPRFCPGVADGALYLGTNDSNMIYAIDTETGDEEWAFDAPDSVSCPPTIVDGSVYVGTSQYSSHFYSLDAATGTEEWRFTDASGSIWVSAAVTSETAYIPCDDNSLYAVNLADGALEWSFETDDSLRSAPIAVGETIYVGSTDENLYAIDQSGTEQWRFQTEGKAGSPVYADGTLFVGSGYDDTTGALYALTEA
jgi:outer membrane protein assembly factor BamB